MSSPSLPQSKTFIMIYDQQILRILSEVGMRGISVRILAKHVYNMNTNLFFTHDKDNIHRYVQQFLLRNSKSPQSLIENAGRRGYYRLNTENSADARQLMIQFQDRQHTNTDDAEKPIEDLSLNLFD